MSVTETQFAGVAADEQLRTAVLGLCRPGAITAVVQPVVRPADMEIVGYEALARMSVQPRRPPDQWLEIAAAFDLRRQLELACLRAAADLGAPPEGRTLFVNAGPSTLAHPEALELRDSLSARLVVEVTEQEAVDDYEFLRRCLGKWLAKGVRLAVDDAGAGYSSLRHVVELSPDYLKLDRELVRGIDEDPTRQALMRAVVAFAREVGTSVIAEGVETQGELGALRDAHVHLVQGYLLARPAPPWPDVRRPARRPSSGGESGSREVTGRLPTRADRLRDELGQTENVVEACEIVAEELFRHYHLMSSLYLARDQELRCVAQRGLWQVLDGLSATAGITGRTWSTGKAIVLEDVSMSPDYLEAIPGVISEVCVPIVVESDVVGSLNVESLTPLPAETLTVMEDAAGALADRLSIIGTNLGNTRWQRAARASVAISGLMPSRRLAQQVLHRLIGAADMDSACLVLHQPEGPHAVTASGPLAGSLLELTVQELTALSGLVDEIRSSYTAGDASGLGFVGTETLRAAGARAVVVLPLWARRQRLGTLILAHSRPLQLSGDRIEPLELLADNIAAVLASTTSAQGDHPSE